MLKQHKDPYGYKKLLLYQKAEELQMECRKLSAQFPRTKTMIDLADQMDRSARSIKQNIVEGWKRNSTDEYHTFLGFSIAANAELEEDCRDIWNGVYPELEAIRGVMGERGERGGEMGEKGMDINPIRPFNPVNPTHPIKPTHPIQPINPVSPIHPIKPLDITKLRFYPLDRSLPPVVQLYLRCREINLLIDRLQASLLAKMKKDNTLSQKDKFALNRQREAEADKWLEEQLLQSGFVRLSNGQLLSPAAYKSVKDHEDRVKREKEEASRREEREQKK